MSDFEPFPVGTVFNPLARIQDATLLKSKSRVTIETPSRLSCGSLDSSRITAGSNHAYTAGELVVAVDVRRRFTVESLSDGAGVEIVSDLGRSSLIRHAEALARSAIGYECRLRIGAESDLELPHCGLGTSSALIAGVVIAINELFGRPLPDAELARYLAQNHGEEIAGTAEWLQPVQCLGGSGAAALFRGGLLALAGQTTLIAAMDIPDTYDVVLAVPRGRIRGDAARMMRMEQCAFPGFIESANRHAQTAAYRMVHEVLPAMQEGDLRPAGRLIYDHRFNWGSIRNCSFSHPRLLSIAAAVSRLYKDGAADILGLSSAGPAFYAVTKTPDPCVNCFEAQDMECYVVKAHNDRYRLL